MLLLGILTVYGCYHLSTGIPGARSRRAASRPALAIGRESPRVTFLVSAYRERDTIVPCINSILDQPYPKDRLSVVVVADEDGEGTVEVLRDEARRRGGRCVRNVEGDEVHYADRLTLIVHGGARSGRGKPRALQNALRYVPREGFVGILDADHLLLPDFLEKTMPHFDEPRVGIVQARRSPQKPPRSWISRWDVLEQNVGQIQALIARDRIGCASFYGSTALIRAELMHEVGWENSLAEDTLLNYESRERGYRVAYELSTGSLETHVDRLRQFIPQRRRWAAGHMQVMFSKLGRLKRPGYRGLSRLEAIFHLNYYNATLFLLTYWLLRATHYWIQGPSAPPWVPLAGTALTAAGAILFERSLGRGGLPAHGAVVAGLLGFSVTSLVAAWVAPPPSPPPVPIALEAALFLAPVLQMALGYTRPELRPRGSTRLDHAMNIAVLVAAAPFMLFVNLYCTLTGTLVSIETSNASWVKTVRQENRRKPWSPN